MYICRRSALARNPPPGIWGFRAPVCRRSVHETPGKNSRGFVRLPCAGACAVSILFQCCFNTVSILFQYCFNTVSMLSLTISDYLQPAAYRLQAAACSLQPAGNPLGLARPRICKNPSFFDDFSNPYTLSSKSYTLSSNPYTLSSKSYTLSSNP